MTEGVLVDDHKNGGQEWWARMVGKNGGCPDLFPDFFQARCAR
jgi:hypothetical protein